MNDLIFERGPEGHVYTDHQLALFTDFECGNGCRPRREGDGYALDLEPDPGNHRFSGKSYYFCCGLRNRAGQPLSIRLRLYANMNGLFGRDNGNVVVRTSVGWDHLPPERSRRVIDSDAIDLLLDLPVDDTPLFISNFYWHSHSELVDWAEGLRAHPLARISSCGKSAAGRPICRIDIGPEQPNAPCIVMSQTPQPSEGVGTWVCRAIVDWLIGEDADAVRLRAAYRLIVLPATNPDGTVLGFGVSHPSGRFPYFEGRLTAEGSEDALPEMRAVWDVLQRERPLWFIEWHGNNWARRPGHMLLRYRPHLLESAGRRALWERIDEALLALPDTYHGNWTDHHEGIYQDSIGFQAVTRLGCIAHMIKHHDKHPLDTICRHAIACLKQG